jgi:DNA topoisomerase-3
LPVPNKAILEKQTKPKPLYNEASLLKALETAGKEIDDEELRYAMKDSGLGTPATRASIIETLIKRDYVLREKKNLLPTKMGMAVLHRG